MQRRDSISRGQAIGLVALFIVGTTAMTSGDRTAKSDTWIALLLAFLGSIPLLIMYARISKLHACKNMFDIIPSLCGRVLGWILCMMMTAYCIMVCILVTRNIMDFVHVSALRKTPLTAIALPFILLGCWLVYKKPVVMGRIGLLLAVVVALIIVASFLLLLPNYDFGTLQPVFSYGISKISKSAFGYFTFPFIETVILLGVFGGLKKDVGRCSTLLIGSSLGCLLLLVSVLRNIMTLGSESFSLLYFPSYIAVSTINIGDFFQRAEALIASNLIASAFIKFSVCLYASSQGCRRLFGTKGHRVFIFPIALLVLILSQVFFRTSMDILNFSEVFRYAALPFQIVIPAIVWIRAEIVHRRKRRLPGCAVAE